MWFKKRKKRKRVSDEMAVFSTCSSVTPEQVDWSVSYSIQSQRSTDAFFPAGSQKEKGQQVIFFRSLHRMFHARAACLYIFFRSWLGSDVSCCSLKHFKKSLKPGSLLSCLEVCPSWAPFEFPNESRRTRAIRHQETGWTDLLTLPPLKLYLVRSAGWSCR